MIRLYFLGIISFFYSLNLRAQDCQLNPPTGLYISDISSCSATLHWTTSADVAKCVVNYKLSSSSQWSAPFKVKKDTFFTFTGLLPGKKYDFAVRTKCTDGSNSPLKKKSGKTLNCTLPDMVSILPVNPGTAKILIQTSCPYDTFHVKYHTLSGPVTIKSFAAADSFFVNGLLPDSTYFFEVSTCRLQLNNWTTDYIVHMPKQPNIVFILIDDARFDYFSCEGAFPFFHTPHVDQIAHEGVDFKRAYVVTSMCAPSRASIATGLFTLKTGVTENGYQLDTSFTTLPTVMRQHGYYTALVGKNHGTFLQNGKNEFDYSLVSLDENQGQIQWGYNGVSKIINKPNVEVCTDSSIGLINKIDKPLFLWLAYRTPHYPSDPLPQYVGKFQTQPLPWKPDTARYYVNYPSYLYDGNQIAFIHGEKLDSIYRVVLEVVAGLDSCIGQLYNALQSSGKLDNTLLIFMDDNGFTLGSHWLNGKSMAYEPSMRVPLLVRYPEWFTPGTVITDRFASNLDIAPTMYEAAGINYTLPLDGKSLRATYTGEFKRTEFYYLMLHDPNSSSPTKRAIRDPYFKYIHYTCNSDTVEDFFDMVNDSLELTNLINNHLYDSLVQVYRMKFDSQQVIFGDTAVGPIKSCFIENPMILKQIVEDAEDPPLSPVIYPTITRNSVQVYIPWKSATAVLYNDFGQAMKSWQIEDTYSELAFPPLPEGIYYLHLSNETESVTRKLIITAE